MMARVNHIDAGDRAPLLPASGDELDHLAETTFQYSRAFTSSPFLESLT